MNVDRTRVVPVILAIRNAMVAEQASGAGRSSDARTSEIVQRACADHAISVDEWIAALEADPEIARLYDQAMDELVLESPDPGPYDVISRESARGAPEPEPEAFARDARLLGRNRE